MNKMTLIAASLSTALLWGCSVQGHTARQAIAKCATHGGLQEIYNDAFSQHAVCFDGTIMQYVSRPPGVETAVAP